MFKFKKSFFMYLIFCSMILIAVNSPEILSSVQESLALCFSSVIPSLFPFMVLSSMFVSLTDERTFKVPGLITKRVFGIGQSSVSAFICGMLCGYPIGAKCTADLYREKKISASEAESLIACSNNSGPLFVIGAVGVGIFGSLKAGVLLYTVQIAAALASAIMLKGHTTYPVSRSTTSIRESKDFTDCVCSSVVNVLSVCGFIVFFSVVNVLMKPVFSLMPDFASCLCSCILEITNGISLVSIQGLPLSVKLSMTSFALGWSGFSVHMQVKSLIKDTGLSMRKYYVTRLFIGIVSSVITYIAIARFDSLWLFVCKRRALVAVFVFLLCMLAGFVTQKKERDCSPSF